MGLQWAYAPVALRALPFVLGGLLLGSCAQIGERSAEAPLVSPNRSENSVAVWPKRSIGTRDRPNARAEWFYGQRAYPQAKIPDGARQKALLQASKIPEVAKRSLDGSKAGPNSLWTAVGPLGFNSNVAPSWGQMSGRVRSIAIDPTNPDRLLLGVSTGGVWLTNDGGGNWTPLTDDQPSLVIGAVAFAPSNPQIIYAGTGEGNGSYYSVGILKSTDGGANWQVLGANDFSRAAISGLLVDPTNPDVVVLCATQGSLGSRGGALVENSIGGIYRSTDGGQTYTRTIANFCRGLHSVPDDFNVMYHSATGVGAQNGLYRSNDAGQSWSLVSGAVNGEDVQRLAVGLSRDGNRIYIGGQKGSDIVIQRSSDGGQSWTDPQLTPLPGEDDDNPGNPLTYCESQCDYDNVIAVNPFNPDDVYFGGVGLYRSTDGAASFNRVGENNQPPAPGQNGPLHVDHHALVYHPTVQGLLFNGNDGGIYRTTDGGANWTSLSGTIATLQHYHISLHPTDPNIIFTGNQDNGTTRRTNSNTWTEIAGGDGAFSAVDFSNPQIVFASTTNLNILKSTNGGDSFSPAGFEREQGEPVDFIAPFVMDPLNSQVLYAGTNRLWRTTDSAANWAPISSQLTSTDGATLSYIAVARSDTSIVYTVASDGTVGRYTPAGGNIVSAAPLPGRYATGVAVSPTDANTVYVSYSGFNSATPDTPGHVFRSTDGGASWTNVSDNLPDAPANAVAIRPDQPNEIYVGTDVGVFISFNGGGGWERMGNGIPNAVIGSLAVNGATGILAAATYGRSVYVTELGGMVPTGPQDEPSLVNAALPVPNPPNASCPSGFFNARVGDGPGSGVQPGIFGLEVLLDAPGTRKLAGGLNFGGLIDVSQRGFAAVNLANSAGENQLLNISLTGSARPGLGSSLPVRLKIERRSGGTSTTVFEQVANLTVSQPFQTTLEVPPGFYVAGVAAEGFPASEALGAPEGRFFFSLTTSFVNRPGGGFQGGAVVGGYHGENPFGDTTGFAAFCLATPHTISAKVFGAPTYGATRGARDLRLRVLDANQQVIYSVP
jgi:photosystem II stability/assembly factor-like uncharacterized protein